MDETEYDGTRPLNMQPRFSESEPPFMTPPGSNSSTVRAYWALAKWISMRDGARTGTALLWVVFPLPWSIGLVGWFGYLAVREVLTNRTGRWLLALPFSPRWLTVFLWAYAVLLFPALYVVAEWCWWRFAGIARSEIPLLSVALIAAGFPALATLGIAIRPLGPVAPSRWAAIQLQLARALEVVPLFLAFLVLMVPGSDRESRHIASLTASVIAAGIIVLSFVCAKRSFGTARLAAGLTRHVASKGRAVLPTSRPKTFSPYWGLWVPQTFIGLRSLLAIMIVAAGLFSTQEQNDKSPFPSYSTVLILACGVALYVFERTRLDFRVIRALPVPRSRQALIVFTPMLVSLGIVCALTFIVLRGEVVVPAILLLTATGFTMAVIVVNATAEPAAVVLLFLLVGVPLFGLQGLNEPPPPWILAIIGSVLIIASYALLYRQLGGNGRMYNRKALAEDAQNEFQEV